MADTLLEITGLGCGYGEGLVLEDIALSVPRGGALALLGRNGVGKSTLMLAIAGHLSARAGTLRWRGSDITYVSPHARARLGIGWVPQEREVFPSLTVEENLDIAVRPGPWSRGRLFALFPRLAERRRNLGRNLSGGEQQMLAIARALAGNPSLLLLDEPLEGLAPVIVAEIAARIPELIREEGLGIILAEQHAQFALELTRQVIVLERGRIVHAGESAVLAADQARLESLIGMQRMAGADALVATRRS